MNFTRIAPNFYKPDANGSLTQQFIYWSNAPASTGSFIFNDAFVGDASQKWVMIFAKGLGEVTSINPQELEKLLTGGPGFNAVILWLDGFDLITSVEYMRRKRFIFLNRNIIFSFNLAPVPDNSNRSKYLISFGGLDNATITITADAILFKAAAGATPRMRINKGQVTLKNPGILLKTDRDFGSLIINADFREAEHIPLASSFLSASLLPSHATAEPVIAFEVFDPKSFAQSFSLEGNYFPFEDIVFNNTSGFDDVNNYTSNFKLINRNGDDLVSNFIDEQGRQFVTSNLSTLNFNFSKIGIIENNRGHDRYILRPLGNIKLSVKDEASHMLMGFSGTEAIGISSGAAESTINIEFKDSDSVLVDEKNSKLKSHFAGTRTTLIQLKNDTDYFLDSEHAPQFENQLNGFETAYKYRPNKKMMPGEKPIPIIPTLGFRGNPALQEMEKVFTSLRLDLRTDAPPAFAEENKEYITPQGFKVKADTYDFMRFPDNAESYRFRIDKVDVDFNVSITKEDVFFVTTPEFIRKAGTSVLYDIRFGLSNFVLDLGKVPGDAGHGEYIIIFKYSKRKFKELLNDVTKWSNYGKYESSADMVAAKKAINDHINSFPQNNEDYAYFNDKILNDANWNGVVVLNVPLGGLPVMFDGLTASQNLTGETGDDGKLSLKSKLRFQYMALPVNKTAIEANGLTNIISNSFFGLIDYDLLKEGGKGDDFANVKKFFTTEPKFKFALTKLLVRFENSQIRRFQSFVFVLVPELFENKVDKFSAKLTHKFPGDDTPLTETVDKLIRLRGVYQKNDAGEEEFIFDLDTQIGIEFTEGNLLKSLNFSRASFSYEKGIEKKYRFDFDASVTFQEDVDLFDKLLKFEELKFQNIGLRFKLDVGLPNIKFDISRLIPIPTIKFDGKGFLSSFPIRFSSFKAFNIFKGFHIPDLDFFNIFGKDSNLTDEDYDNGVNLWGLIFDFDLGTLGDLSFLKNLKGKLLVGWFKKGGLRIGLKLDGPSMDGLHVDLFGALKLDITKVDFGRFKPQEENGNGCSAYFLRLINARLTVFGTTIPNEGTNFNGIIIADFSKKISKKIAWLISLDDNEQDLLLLGVGQRMGPPTSAETTTDAIKLARDTFKIDLKDIKPCDTPNFYDIINFRPERNWLVASEDVLALISKDWSNVVLLKFIFNDPILYGIYLGIRGDSGFTGFAIDILYRKLSESLGVWSTDIQLPDSIRNQDFGGGAVTFPNIGLQIYTNGDWKVDIGYPRTSDDWSRSCLFQIRPFVGWAGFYLARLRTVSLTLFGPYMQQFPDELGNCNIIQTGFAFRIGIGAYIDKGIFFAGASLSIFGILEGAFAFKQGQTGLAKFFPDHFALRGRVGAIAEIIGYVDFKIVKASVYVILRVEFGMLLVVIKGHGLQPVPVYIEGRVSVRISITIACFRIFRKKICIVLNFSFGAIVRFEYTIGGGGQQGFLGFDTIAPFSISVPIKRIPVVYTPALSLGKENDAGTAVLHYLHNFALPFFGIEKFGEDLKFSDQNILQNDIILPLFTAIIEALKAKGITANYENLRAVMLRGEILNGDVSVPVKLSFADYRPLFISGKNLNTDKELLKTVFHFTETEATRFLEVNADKCNSGENAECPFRLITIPVWHKIVVQSPQLNADVPVEFQNGFSIVVENLATGAGGNNRLLLEIKEDRSYSEDDIKKIENYFDAFKTQFVERNEADAAGFEDFDLRSDFVVPEYFKLIGLLALEAYAGVHEKTEDRKRLYNPAEELSTNMIVADTRIGWELNKKLESIAGQLNYFFNHGLRLPDKTVTDNDMAWFSFLGQSSVISGASNASDAEIRLQLVNGNGSDVSVSLLRDIFANDSEVEDFRKHIETVKQTDLGSLGNDFATKELEPFERAVVVLPVPNSSLHTSDKLSRYYNLPARLRTEAARQQFNEKYACKVKLSNNDNNNRDVLPAKVCANAEISVKPHKKNGKVQVLEIVNVYIDDLDLMNLVKNNQDFADSISLYLKTGNDATPELINLVNNDLAIVKTNLSPKTHPPVIIDNNSGFDVSEEFVAAIGQKSEFIKLVWEGLTTNNGGYYFLLDHDALPLLPDTDKQYTVVLSFETTQSQFPGFCNAFKISDINNMFANLDKGTHYLSIDEITVNGTEVKEYHSRIPAHCFGFEIVRPKLSEAVSQYLPVEFVVKQPGDAQSNSRTLPLMPQGENELVYKHIIPTVAVKSKINAERYNSINKTTLVEFGIRDIYGFKAARLNKPLNHVHKYFDKLLPLSAWPFISFSFDFVSYTAVTKRSSWKLNAVLDSANVADMLKTTEDRNRILETLYTAKAQVNDQNCAIFISHGMLKIERNKLVEVIDLAIKVTNEGSAGNTTFSIALFEIAESAETPLRTAINSQIVFERKKDDCINVAEKVWEKDSIVSISNEINLASSPPLHNPVQELNNKLKSTPFVLGVTSDVSRHRIHYLINKQEIASIAPLEITPLPLSAYYGIKPYSNKLWSGTYNVQDAEHRFTDVDLDTSLRLILAQIDKLISANNLTGMTAAATIDDFRTLLRSKRLLVKEELCIRTDNVNEEMNDDSQKLLRDELRDLLLNKLNSFYEFDGIIKLSLKPNPMFSGHRMTVSFDKLDDYNLVSSKLDYRSGEPGWTILFDRQGDGKVNFKCNAHVTHIEYNIEQAAGAEEIESSSWIQLVEPVQLKRAIEVKDWPLITRSFPEKPMITLHDAEQTIADGSADSANWSRKLGEWNYLLSIDDNNKYATGDIIEVVLRTKAAAGISAFAETRNFKGFIAYWSAQIANTAEALKWVDFARDLERQLKLPVEVEPGAGFEAAENVSFELHKTAPNNWQPKVPATSSLPLGAIRVPDDSKPAVVISAFSLFEDASKLQILSVLPEVRVLRNTSIDNKAFHYVTQKVSPADWATPHIRYWQKIACANRLQTVYDTMPVFILPYKSTAKYLITMQPGITSVPVIPVQQMEYNKKKPANIDALFAKYKNGTPAVSITMYHTDSVVELPVFFANTITLNT